MDPRSMISDSTGQATPRIGVVDSGWVSSPPDSRILRGRNFVPSDNDASIIDPDDTLDVCSHGTLCTQLILSVALTASIVPIRVFGKRVLTSPQRLSEA